MTDNWHLAPRPGPAARSRRTSGWARGALGRRLTPHDSRPRGWVRLVVGSALCVTGVLWANGVISTGRPTPASTVVVQSFGAKNTSAGATLSASPTATTTTGDLLVAVIRDRNANALAPVSTVTDSNVGDHWIRAASVTQSTTNADGEIWFVANAASLATSQSVTVTVGGTQASKSAIAFTVLDVTGAATSSPLDVFATANGKTQPASTGITSATTQASEIAVGDIGWNSAGVSPSGQTAGYATTTTQQSTVSGNATGEQAAWQLLNAMGTQTYSATLSPSSVAWTGVIATFKVGAPPPPTISSFSPTDGVIGATVVINGTGFTGTTAVVFNVTNQPAYTVNSDIKITTTVPSGATTGAITVTAPGGPVTSSSPFTVDPSPTPTITNFNPTSGVVGTPVTITGTGFTGASAVTFFNNVAATFTVTDDFHISTSVPTGAATGVIKVTTPGGTATSSTSFDVIPFGTLTGTVTDAATSAAIAGASVSYSATGITPPHVMVIMEENKGYQATLGACGLVPPPDPYYCSLASSYASDTSWFGVGHPSLPNYLAFDSGSVQGCTTDTCLPGYTVTDLGGQLTAAGVPWTGYMESMPTACDLTSGPIPYARKHNPFVYFTDVSGNACATHDVPYPGAGGLVSALTGANAPAFVWITPNLTDDMHDGTVQQGDQWLQANLPGVLTSSWFTAGNATVIITMDENQVQSTPAGGQVPMVVISRSASGKGNVAISGNHYGSLRTIEAAYGLGYLGAASDPANGDLSTLFDVTNRTTTDTNGHYSLTNVTPGTYTVTASDAGYTTQQAPGVTVASGATTTKDFALAVQGGAISGTVTDSVTNVAIAGANISYTGPGGVIGSTTTIADGSYGFGNLTAGSYQVTATASNYQSQTATVSVVQGVSTPQNFALVPQPGTISGTVKDSGTNVAIAGATVSYIGPGGSSGSSAPTGGDGKYTLTMLPEGSYQVTATATNYSSQTVTVNVAPAATTTQDFALTFGAGSISGKVTDSVTAAAIGGALVSYSGGSTTTASDGTYTLSNVAPGTYTVTASDTGYTTQPATGVTVNSGATATKNFALVPQPGTISGTVTDSGTNVAIAGATVSYTGPGGSSGSSAPTGGDGKYTLTMLPEGSYQVTAAATNHTSQTVPVNLAPGATATQNFALVAGGHQPIFSDGFESGTFSAWTTTSGLVVEGTTIHTGTHAAEGKLNNSPMYAQKLLPSTYNSGYERAYFNIISQTSQINVLRARTASGSNLAYVLVDTSHHLDLNVLGTKVATSTTVVSAGSGWHELEMYVAINGATPSVEVWLDGIQVTSLTWNGSVGSTPVGEIQIGEASGQTWDVAFDDAAFDTQFLP